jgi:glyoxylase-like metal-dependent hydrolase (beta-lactamase superfamily II)
MFSGMFPFVDITSGGSFLGFTAASQAMADMITDETRIIPGHGPLSGKSDIADIVAMLEGTMAAVQAEIDAGKDLEGVLDAAPLTPWVEDWAWGFINEARFTRLIFEDLSRAAD